MGSDSAQRYSNASHRSNDDVSGTHGKPYQRGSDHHHRSSKLQNVNKKGKKKTFNKQLSEAAKATPAFVALVLTQPEHRIQLGRV
jgi:hypothetical protein